MEQAIVQLAAQFPVVMTILLVIGILRVVVKPLMSILREVAILTPTDKDNKALDAVEASAAYKTFCYVLDWFASIKVGTQVK